MSTSNYTRNMAQRSDCFFKYTIGKYSIGPPRGPTGVSIGAPRRPSWGLTGRVPKNVNLNHFSMWQSGKKIVGLSPHSTHVGWGSKVPKGVKMVANCKIDPIWFHFTQVFTQQFTLYNST